MSRMRSSWLSVVFRRDRRVSPIVRAQVERRLRTEADHARAPLPAGLPRRTLDALQQVEPGGGAAVPPFRRRSMALSSLSLAALLMLAGLIGQRLAAPPSTGATPSLSQAVSMPSPHTLQQQAQASIRIFERRTGIDLGRPDVADPLMSEAKAMWRDASRAADAILASVPKRYVSDDARPGRSG